MVCPPFRWSCFSLFSLVFLLVSFCWMVCPPSRGFCFSLFPLVFFLFLFVGWCVRLPEILFPFWFLLFSYMCVCFGCCIPLPKVLSPFISHCFPIFMFVLDGISTFSRFCFPCFLVISQFFFSPPQFVSYFFFLFSLCGGRFDFAFFFNNELLGIFKAFLRVLPGCWMMSLLEVLAPILSSNLFVFCFFLRRAVLFCIFT